MNKSLLLVLTALITSVIFGSSPQNAFAQRGGHGGGGGFHAGRGMGFSGGGSMGFYGGSAGRLHSGGGHQGYGNFYGGHYGIPYGGGRGYYGYHAGYGWHGGYRRYPYYGWGWGFGWPYWGWGWGYGYYGYNPWYSAPYLYYSYPDYCSPGYSCPPNGNDDLPPADSSPKPGRTPAKPQRPDESTPDMDDGSRNASATSHGSVLSTAGAVVPVSNYRVANSTQGYTPVSPEVQNAMRALREMPPFARLREIETGRYSHLTAEERALLRNVK